MRNLNRASVETPGEWIGKAYGWILGALTAGVSAVRHARTFHPRGIVYEGTAIPLPSSASEIANSLSGRVLVRLSTALWKNDREWTDVLGIAIRFSGSTERAWNEDVKPTDQDLLFATVPHPALLFVAPFLTNVHDYFQNLFYAVSPFSHGEEDEDRERCSFRLRPEDGESREGSRRDKVNDRVAEQRANWILEIRFERVGTKEWQPCAKILLERPANVNQEALRFYPFHSGKGLHPRGFIHFLRIGAYRASQSTRPIS